MRSASWSLKIAFSSLIFGFWGCAQAEQGSLGTPGAGLSASTGGSAPGAVNDPGPSLGGSLSDAPPLEGACQNLDCYKPANCAAGTKTTLSGTVFDPAGKLPLYNVLVWIPNSAVPPVTPGASCDRCAASAIDASAATLTDTHGRFVLEDVPVLPAGMALPLVIQVGKWRRQVQVQQSLTACSDTALLPELTRLPRNQSEGDLPQIAITTGGSDSLECLPLRMGVDPAEFTSEAGTGRIHLYAGGDSAPVDPVDISTKAFDAAHGAATMTQAATLWSDLTKLKKYDMVLMSCEGTENSASKPEAARQALYDYESLGGRVFATHFHYEWFSLGPSPVPQIATWARRGDPPDPVVGNVNMAFPKGQALGEWLVNVGASTAPGQLNLTLPRDNVHDVNSGMATPWITITNSNLPAPNENVAQFLSYNAPLGAAADQVCGRAVYSNVHVSGTTDTGEIPGLDDDRPGQPFPSSCHSGDLSPQEKALAFMLFDLSSCILDDDVPPKPPK